MCKFFNSVPRLNEMKNETIINAVKDSNRGCVSNWDVVTAGAEVLHVAFDNDTRDFERRLRISDRNAIQLADLARQGADNLGIVAVLDLGLDADTNLRGVC